ncbi:hypothetical protein HYX16_02155 [Candidatus Woesearchaeota archaeon]|nr:hypothetical protein [Candidatus Woesearchaeota archaeon]
MEIKFNKGDIGKLVSIELDMAKESLFKTLISKGIRPSKIEVFGKIVGFSDDYLTIELGSVSPVPDKLKGLTQKIPYENIISYKINK